MEAVVFCGIQASGKTTFYLERFFQSHVRLNLDMLKTRHREQVPISGLLGTYKRQEVPSPREGFHRLFRVRTQSERFLIEDLEVTG